jgi:microcystin-dependent protein
MAGLRISQLPLATAITSADLLPFSSVSGSETRRIPANTLAIALGLLGATTGPTQPTTPANGQLWVDTSTNPPVLKVWNGATFTIVSFLPGSAVITNPSATAPSSPVLGQLWQDTSQTPDELKMWDGTNWVRPDPDGITQAFADARYLQIATAASTYLPLSGGTLTGNLTLVGAPITNNMAATKKYVDDEIASIPAAAAGVPAGSVIWTAGTSAPTGYLKANGAAVSRSTYAALFGVIGTLYGSGDGSTTFNLPDLRGEFIRGWDDGRGVDAGRVFASAQAQAYQSHTHTGSTDTAGSHAHSYDRAVAAGDNDASAGSTRQTQDATQTFGTSSAGSHSHSFTTNASGGTETRPRNIALLACVKV